MPSMAFTKYSHFHVIGKLLFILIAKFVLTKMNNFQVRLGYTPLI